MTPVTKDIEQIRAIMRRLEIYSRGGHTRYKHNRTWIDCTTGTCIGDKAVLGERYLEERI